MADLFHTIVYLPIYNLLIFLVDIVPGGDVGLAVIAATLAVKLVLLPLSLSAARTQRVMRTLEPELKRIKDEYKDNQEGLAKATFALYKEKNVRPFASMLMLFIQLPILFGLYYVSRNAITANPSPDLLYSFVHLPAVISPVFLGIFALTGPSLVLAIVAAITQGLQAWYLIPATPKKKEGSTMQEDMTRAISMQAKFIYPLLIGVIAYTTGILALYFTASSLFMIGQEFVVRKLHPATT